MSWFGIAAFAGLTAALIFLERRSFRDGLKYRRAMQQLEAERDEPEP